MTAPVRATNYTTVNTVDGLERAVARARQAPYIAIDVEVAANAAGLVDWTVANT